MLKKSFLFALICVCAYAICFACLKATQTAYAQPVSAEPVQGAEIKLPILMYHKVFTHTTGRYVVSPQQLENDFIAIKEAGFTPVFMREVIDWVDGRGTLPEKPIVITFDDGHYNNLYYALPIAKKHNVKIMVSPITSYSKFSLESGDHSNPKYSYLTWEQLREMTESGLCEIGNHTHHMHEFKPRFGISKLSAEDDAEYERELRADIEHSNALIMGSGCAHPTTFAYPFGKYNKKAREILVDMDFRALLTCNELVSTVTQGDPTTLHQLGRFNREGDYSTEKVLKLISK